MTRQVYGSLDAFSGQEGEGIRWALQQDDSENYDGLFILDDDDYLEVFNMDGSIRWEGNIDLDWQIGFQPVRVNDEEIGQQVALGYWVNGIQRGSSPDAWAQLFFDRPPARLTREDTELSVEQIEKIADE